MQKAVKGSNVCGSRKGSPLHSEIQVGSRGELSITTCATSVSTLFAMERALIDVDRVCIFFSASRIEVLSMIIFYCIQAFVSIYANINTSILTSEL